MSFSFELCFLNDVLGHGSGLGSLLLQRLPFPHTDPHTSVSWLLSVPTSGGQMRGIRTEHTGLTAPGAVCAVTWLVISQKSVPFTPVLTMSQRQHSTHKVTCPCSPHLQTRKHLGLKDCQWEGEPRMEHRGTAV